MVGWHHRLKDHEFEQAPGDGEGQGSLVCCSPWGRKKSNTTERLNLTELPWGKDTGRLFVLTLEQSSIRFIKQGAFPPNSQLFLKSKKEGTNI